jgi:hypothetical protein
MIEIPVKDLLENKDKYELLEYGNVENFDSCNYMAVFNNNYSYNDIEANSKEGWIKVLIANVKTEPILEQKKFIFLDFYIVKKENGEFEPAIAKLYGDVVIFKLDRKTAQPILKS